LLAKQMMTLRLALALAAAVLVLAACGGPAGSELYVPDLLDKAQQYNGKQVTVSGAYIARDGKSLLAPGVSTQDNGLDAQPLGDPIWVEGFPESVRQQLHQPGDAVYGFVRVTGQFDAAGGYGPERQYKYQIRVESATPIEQVRRNEVRIPNEPLPAGQVALTELAGDPAKHNGQQVTTRGYYFWNGPLAVLAEGVSTEEDGSSPQPIGKQIWMEGFPPQVSGELTIGPNNSFVWGYVEVTGAFAGGGSYGKNGAYSGQLNVTAARALPAKK
jgi:hypothetical protein